MQMTYRPFKNGRTDGRHKKIYLGEKQSIANNWNEELGILNRMGGWMDRRTGR